MNRSYIYELSPANYSRDYDYGLSTVVQRSFDQSRAPPSPPPAVTRRDLVEDTLVQHEKGLTSVKKTLKELEKLQQSLDPMKAENAALKRENERLKRENEEWRRYYNAVSGGGGGGRGGLYPWCGTGRPNW
jgi:FtsZ-binding cell division protein ZapB